jgi:hypothetical protein
VATGSFDKTAKVNANLCRYGMPIMENSWKHSSDINLK